MGFVSLCRPAAIGAGSAAELSRFGVFPECQKLLPADGTDCRPGGLPVLRLGVSVLPLESAPVRAELLRSASLRLDNRHSTVRAKAGRHSFQIFLRCCRVQWALPPSSVHSRLKFSSFFRGYSSISPLFSGVVAATTRRKQGVFLKKHPKKHKKRRSFSPRFRHQSEALPSPFCAGLPMESSTQWDAHTGVLHRFSCIFLCF